MCANLLSKMMLCLCFYCRCFVAFFLRCLHGDHKHLNMPPRSMVTLSNMSGVLPSRVGAAGGRRVPERNATTPSGAACSGETCCRLVLACGDDTHCVLSRTACGTASWSHGCPVQAGEMLTDVGVSILAGATVEDLQPSEDTQHGADATVATVASRCMLEVCRYLKGVRNLYIVRGAVN